MENKENLPEIKQVAGVPTIDGYAENLQQKLQMCKLFRESGFAPASFKSDGAVLAAILYGQELGFTPIQSLQSVDVIQGKPTLSAQGIKAKIIAEGGVIRELEWTDKVCRIEGDRAGNKVITEYSIEEAVKAGLAGKDNWRRMPKDMLYARCISRYGRNHWADKLKGVYGAEEMRDAVIVKDPEGGEGGSGAPAVIVADALPAPEASQSEAMPEGVTPMDIVKAREWENVKNSWSGQAIVNFGKHKGKTWAELSGDYIEWLFQNTKGDLATQAGFEIHRREQVEQEKFEDINNQAAAEQSVLDEFDRDELPDFNNKGA